MRGACSSRLLRQRAKAPACAVRGAALSQGASIGATAARWHRSAACSGLSMHRLLTGGEVALTLLLTLTKLSASCSNALIDASVSPSAAPYCEEAGGREGRGTAQQNA